MSLLRTVSSSSRSPTSLLHTVFSFATSSASLSRTIKLSSTSSSSFSKTVFSFLFLLRLLYRRSFVHCANRRNFQGQSNFLLLVKTALHSMHNLFIFFITKHFIAYNVNWFCLFHYNQVFWSLLWTGP